MIFSLLKIHTQHSKKPSPIPAGAFCFLFSLFRTSAKEAAALVPRGEQRLALHGSRGILSFSKESIPLKPPRERTRGLAPRPRTLADRHLKSCAACGIGCGVRGFATNLLLFVADINRALLRGARVTVVRRRTACGRHCFARRRWDCCFSISTVFFSVNGPQLMEIRAGQLQDLA